MGKGSTPLLAMAVLMAVSGTAFGRSQLRDMTFASEPSYKGIKHNKRRRGRKPR
jgi:hypothetical protein